jgi:pyruvate dehydrogenase E1 component alpha subunit
MSDPAKYRSKEEVAEVREKHDPIEQFAAKLMQRGIVNENDLKMMDSEIKQTVIAAASFATESPEPPVAELYTDIVI